MAEELVRDWMHRGVITCGPETPIQTVADAMKAHDISALVVVDEAGDAIGVISRTDLVNARFVEPYLKHWRGLTAKHLMSAPVISVSDATPLAEAAARLRDRKIHRVVVTERRGPHEKPIGILSVTDLVGKL
ncbi:MAG: CBS domain-containing protein [candidate division NC10 bacterium]|nr:CBS domain-containing protein [candidate division NC10 bacterium]MDE2484055.1 CBS domain-containing protein [candidate division NC10 bacterium]